MGRHEQTGEAVADGKLKGADTTVIRSSSGGPRFGTLNLRFPDAKKMASLKKTAAKSAKGRGGKR